MGKIRLSKEKVAELQDKVEALILEQAPKLIPSEEKMEQVLDDLAVWLDDRIKWGWLGPLAIPAEMADGPAIRQGLESLLQLVTQLVYDRLKAAGRV